MKRIAAVLMLLTLAGCGTPGPVQTYEGPARSTDEIAILKGLSTGYRAGFASYARREIGLKTEFTKVRGFGQGYPNEIHLIPGTYIVLVHCSSGQQYAFPSVELSVQEGFTYQIACEQSSTDARKVGAYVSRRTPSKR